MAERGGLRALFEEVLALPRAERNAFLEERVEDAADRTRLAAMVKAQEGAEAGDASSGAPTGTTGRPYPWPGDHVGSYRLVAPIGAGGMGSVWAAESRRTSDIRVAVKFASATHVGADESALRLDQERRILAHLDHPGVARLVDAGDAGPKGAYLVLVFVGGRTFDDFARGAGRRELIGAVGQLARTLDAVHAAGIVHRDVKPSNVLVDDRGWPTLIDFGTARVMEGSAVTSRNLTQSSGRSVAPHTPAFASPEQSSGGPVSPRTDVFGLAKLVEACCASASIEVDSKLRGILERACAEDPLQRHGSTGEFGAALERWAAPGGDRTIWAASMPVRVALGAGLVAIGAALPFWLGGKGPDVSFDGEREGTFPGEFMEALAETPVDALPQIQETFERLAEDAPEQGWEVAAGWIAMETGRVEDARSWAVRARASVGALSIQRLRELGELSARLGLMESAAVALQQVGGRSLEEEEVLGARALELRYRIRSGASVEWSGLEQLMANASSLARRQGLPFDLVMEASLDQAREDEMFSLVYELALETGRVEALRHWLESVDQERRLSPLEEPTRFLYGLLSLHGRLVLQEAVVPLGADALEELDEELWRRWVEDGDVEAMRPWGLVRASRLVALALDEDGEVAEGARWLAEESRSLLDDEGAGAVDLSSTFFALEAAAAARAGDDDDASELWAQALNLAADVGVTFLERMESARRGEPSLGWIIDPWDHLPAEEMNRWRRAVAELVDETEGAAPWWGRTL